jgi:SRSO17 transposase
VAVYLVYASGAGHAVIDRELYLPRAWTCDPDRCQAAGAPDEVGFATKPELATAMITRALDARVPAAWVTADEVYGACPALRAELEARGVGYVLAVARNHPVPVAGAIHRADALLRQVPARAWQCISAGKGAKGHRYYDWAYIRLDDGEPQHDGQTAQHWLLIRRHQRTGELAFYRCFIPRPTPLAVLVGVAGRRWRSASRPARAWSLGPAPGAPLALLVPLDHPGDARPRLPGGRGHGRRHARLPGDGKNATTMRQSTVPWGCAT